jgi:hypothetical protein
MRVQKQWVIPVVVGVVSFGTGVAVGYLLGKRHEESEELPVVIVDEIPEEVEEEQGKPIFVRVDPEEFARQKAEWYTSKKNHPSTQARDDNVSNPKPNPADIKVDPIVLEPGYKVHDDPEINDRMIAEFLKHDRFAMDTDEWDLQEELQYREDNPDVPYVIHKDEFWAEEKGYTQTTLTYYDVDDILVDEDDHPIYGYTKIIGPFRWGHGSGDPNVFHVRNDRLQGEYEILLHKGESYTRDVKGIKDFEEKPVRHPRKKIKPPRE